MKLTTSIIIAATGATSSIAGEWLVPLQTACDKFNIRTGSAVAALLANVGVESTGLTEFEENLSYSAQGLANTWPSRYALSDKTPNDLAKRLARNPQAIANNVYASRLGNGSEESGDGWKFRGRGPIQITGKANYIACGSSIGVDLLSRPDQLTVIDAGALSAAWFFANKGCVSFADLGDIAEVIRRINGALPNTANQGALRLNRYRAAMNVISGQS